MRHQDLRDYVIIPVLKKMAVITEKPTIYSTEAVGLLLMTCAIESKGGFFLHQYPSGPAVGIYQMEPDTHADIWDNYLTRKHGLDLRPGVDTWMSCSDFFEDTAHEMHGNLYYATAMARVHYWRIPEPIPPFTQGWVKQYAEYWDRHWNRNPDPRTGPLKAVRAWYDWSARSRIEG